MQTIGQLLPRFCVELQDLISSAGRADLVDQVPKLPIVSRCTCGEADCAHFFTATPPDGAYGAAHSNVVLPADVGFVALDLLGTAIVAVEVLDRPDVKSLLDVALPVLNAKRATALACPACGFLTIPESSYGSYTICEVCGWEDDGVQLANPARGGGANRESLIEAQAVVLIRFPPDVREADGVPRSASWRPLNSGEIAVATAQRDDEHSKNTAVIEPHDCYWLKGEA